MQTPDANDAARRDGLEPASGEAIPDLEISGEDAPEQVKGGDAPLHVRKAGSKPLDYLQVDPPSPPIPPSR